MAAGDVTAIRCYCRADLETETILRCVEHAPSFREELSSWPGRLALAACVLSMALTVWGVVRVGAWLARVAGS